MVETTIYCMIAVLTPNFMQDIDGILVIFCVRSFQVTFIILTVASCITLIRRQLVYSGHSHNFVPFTWYWKEFDDSTDEYFSYICL